MPFLRHQGALDVPRQSLRGQGLCLNILDPRLCPARRPRLSRSGVCWGLDEAASFLCFKAITFAPNCLWVFWKGWSLRPSLKSGSLQRDRGVTVTQLRTLRSLAARITLLHIFRAFSVSYGALAVVVSQLAVFGWIRLAPWKSFAFQNPFTLHLFSPALVQKRKRGRVGTDVLCFCFNWSKPIVMVEF